MLSRFPTPPAKTKIYFFKDPDSLLDAISDVQPWIVLDEGVPLPFAVSKDRVFRIPGGEKSKRWSELERLLRWLAEKKAERGETLVVIGGGAVLDIAALGASLYRRGMPLILVPTTLLAMVDATLGGKTAVDLELGGRLLKNFAGSFYPAREVWLLADFLSTLPAREQLSGAGECIKTLWIGGKNPNPNILSVFLATGITAGVLSLVRTCLSVKGRIVESDPLDQKRLREVLNFGHTVGHALESLSGLSHGECVLWGMAVETQLLGKRGHVMAALCAETMEMLPGLKQPKWEKYSDMDWTQALGADKKTKGGKIEMSLLEKPGRIVRKRCSVEQLLAAIREFPESYPHA